MVTPRFRHPFFIVQFRPSFAMNTQRNLRLRFWIVDSDDFVTDPVQSGAGARGGYGTSLIEGLQDYIVGDGEEGEKNVPVNRWFPDGKRIAVDAHNLDATNAHTLDVLADLLDATSLQRGAA
jgi:hypothetical protein